MVQPNFIDLAGRCFDHFTVQSRTSVSKPVSWNCLCECGAIFKARSDRIRSEQIKACKICRTKYEESRGYPGENLTGKVFGDLVVQSKAIERKKYWKCLCVCGHTYSVRSDKLRCGITKRCLNCTKNLYNVPINIVGIMPSTYWVALRLRNKHPLEITPEYAYEIFQKQNQKCALSGVSIGFRNDRKNRHTASLDRIDSSKGYEEGNIQWVHKDINRMKNAFGQERFIAWCLLVAETFVGTKIKF